MYELKDNWKYLLTWVIALIILGIIDSMVIFIIGGIFTTIFLLMHISAYIALIVLTVTNWERFTITSKVFNLVPVHPPPVATMKEKGGNGAVQLTLSGGSSHM